MQDNRIAVVKALLQRVWSGGEIECVGEFIADQYTIRHDPGDPWEGRTLDIKGYKDRVVRSRAPFPDQRFEICEIAAGPDAVLVTWTWAGTHQGDFPGLPATGKLVEMSGATAYYFVDGKIVGHWQVADRLGVYQQIQGGGA